MGVRREAAIALFPDRHHAGKVLAAKVKAQVTEPWPLVLALPRGGVPVGFELALALDAELDVLLVRKLGVPGDEELAFGAISSTGDRVLNRDVVQYLRLSNEVIERVTAQERAKLERQNALYRGERPALRILDRNVILTDDGLATGASMFAAVQTVAKQHAKRIIVAVPVAARSTCRDLAAKAGLVICAAHPQPFGSVGAWYEDFTQVSDSEVSRLLNEAANRSRASREANPAALHPRLVLR